ncbi:hypothetical protein OSSY52_22950 [Tepiditoga spiralis]|uniref:Outer membrane lipoprotein carrier protein LolA n=1 Tax=Tepiditoga spiralis TaxID=2108365 RepID=A0A7G1GA44_9BACT|nr:hypothetical protein [Tepiditoga spiralis]BBE32154.1 hypothetical protein OSSY52_22950 [Tepiditoga spiralis]
MMKKLLLLLFLIIILIHGFSINYFEKYISSFTSLKNFSIKIKIDFEITDKKNILTTMSVINNRFYIFNVKKPELFSGIVYVYDLYTNNLYTKVKNSYDFSSDLNLFTSEIPNIMNILTSIFEPTKFKESTIKIRNSLISIYEPKDKIALKLFLGIDYAKFKVYLKNPMNDIYFFDRFEILNSTEKQKAIITISQITQLNDKEASNILNNYLP